VSELLTKKGAYSFDCWFLIHWF